MKKTPLALALVAAVGCSSKSGLVISDFTLDSPLAAGAMTLTGSLQASGTSGLTDPYLSYTITFSGAASGSEATFTLPVTNVTGSTLYTSGSIPVIADLSFTLPAGTSTVAVTLMGTGEASNSLSATVVVQGDAGTAPAVCSPITTGVISAACSTCIQEVLLPMYNYDDACGAYATCQAGCRCNDTCVEACLANNRDVAMSSACVTATSSAEEYLSVYCGKEC